MSDSISIFFDAWEIEEANVRLQKIRSAVAENIEYDDPRTSKTISGIDALNGYVGMFTANAPGWSAKVIKSDTVRNITRATVAFSGEGSDGTKQAQLGQYFVETEGGFISRMTGFVGTGE